MTVVNIEKDPATCTMTITAEFDATIERTWQLWDDPRQLERWWGPPTYPATVTEHNLVAGGRVAYTMTGPEGDTHGGLWIVTSVGAPNRLEIEDWFADEHGEANREMPMTLMTVTLAERANDGTIATITSKFASAEAMHQLIEMGMEEGMLAAAAQMDAIVAE